MLEHLQDWIVRAKSQSHAKAAVLCLAGVCLVGALDYWADYHLLFTVLYVLPIAFATIWVGRAFAILLAVLSVAFVNAGDFLAGAPSPGMGVQIWNDAIFFLLFLIVIYLLDSLHRVLLGLNALVDEKTLALRTEMNERRRLEHEILELAERERQRMGHELHDVVCQELTSISIASHLLAKKLDARMIPEEKDAREIAGMVNVALDHARSLARGFLISGFNGIALEESLREAARNAESRTGIRCELKWQDNLVISNEETVMQLFRITQEALLNAIKHAEPSRIEIRLAQEQGRLQLVIEDDGKGIAGKSKSEGGLGLQIMAYRAGLIGGELGLAKASDKGTRVVCTVPLAQAALQPAVGVA
jgi:signal transduction histidine kinase